MTVRFEGNPNAKITFIAEAPSEIRHWIFQNILGHNGIAESEFNTITLFDSVSSKRFRTFEEVKGTIINLRACLSRLSSYCLVPIGSPALQALSVFEYNNILQTRGSILPARLVRKKMVPIVSPEFIGAHGNAEYRYLHVSISDVSRAKAQAEFPQITGTSRNHRIIYAFDEAIRAIRGLAHLDQWSFDLETSLPCFGFGEDRDNSFTIPLESETHPQVWSESEKAYLIEETRQALTRPGARIILQNGFFDKRVLWKTYGIDPLSWTIYIDTMHLHQLLYPELPHSLAFLTSIYTEEPYYKDEGYNFKRGTGGETAYFTYNGKDCCVTLEAAMEMLSELREIPGQEDYYFKILNPSLQTLFRMHVNGVYIDQRNLSRTKILLKRQETIARIRLLKAAGVEPNPRSSIEMEYFLREIGIKEKDLPRTPKTNKIQLTEDIFDRLYAKYKLPELAAILSLRKNLFIQSGFTNIKTDSDGRYRIVFKLGPKSGRLASSGDDRGPQLQNIPAVPANPKEANIRSIFATPSGRALVSADLEQADARAFAYAIPEQTLISMFESEDQDLFSQLCSLLFNIPRKEISKHGPHSDKRKITKEVGHGTHYGMGPRRLVSSLRDNGIFISEGEARSFQAKYHDRIPGIRVYHNSVQTKIRQTRQISDLLGRRHVFLGFIDNKTFQEAYSRCPQGTVASVMLKGMNQLQEAFDLYEWGQEPFLLIQVHDEIIVEANEEHVMFVASLINTHMRIELEAHGRRFSIPMEINAGQNWGELCSLADWQKKAGSRNILHTQPKMKPRISFTFGADLAS